MVIAGIRFFGRACSWNVLGLGYVRHCLEPGNPILLAGLVFLRRPRHIPRISCIQCFIIAAQVCIIRGLPPLKIAWQLRRAIADVQVALLVVGERAHVTLLLHGIGHRLR